MKNILTKSLAKYYLPGNFVSSNAYFFNNGSSIGSYAILNAQWTAIKLIEYLFIPINVLASKPVFTVTADKVIVNVFYYVDIKNQALNNNTINNLGDVLSKQFQRPVELHLVKLSSPYLNSYILAQYIMLNAQKYNFDRIQHKIFNKTSIVKNNESLKAKAIELPSHIVGIKIRVSGRLNTERSKPRQTVQTAQIGSFLINNKSLVDTAMFTKTNNNGSVTVKVWINQRHNN